MVPGRWKFTETAFELKVFRVEMPRKNQEGNYMWLSPE